MSLQLVPLLKIATPPKSSVLPYPISQAMGGGPGMRLLPLLLSLAAALMEGRMHELATCSIKL